MANLAQLWGPVESFALYTVLGLALGGIVHLVLSGPILSLTRRTRTQLDHALVRVSARPLSVFIVLLGLRLAVLHATTQVGPNALLNGFGQVVSLLMVLVITLWVDAAFVALVAWYLTAVANRTRSRVDDEFLPLVRKLGRVVVWFLGITIALSVLGVNITGLIATAGVASLAVALAAQETLSNMFAGLMIMMDRPFREGDRIQVGADIYGDVLNIGLRSTRILTFDNTVIVVPNKDIAASRVTNHVFPDPSATLKITVGVNYETDIDQAKAILLDIMRSNPKILADPSPAVYFTEIAPSTFNLMLWCKVADYRDKFGVTDELNTQIAKRFAEAGIDMAYQQVNVHLFADTLKLPLEAAEQVRGGQSQRETQV